MVLTTGLLEPHAPARTAPAPAPGPAPAPSAVLPPPTAAMPPTSTAPEGPSLPRSSSSSSLSSTSSSYSDQDDNEEQVRCLTLQDEFQSSRLSNSEWEESGDEGEGEGEGEGKAPEQAAPVRPPAARTISGVHIDNKHCSTEVPGEVPKRASSFSVLPKPNTCNEPIQPVKKRETLAPLTRHSKKRRKRRRSDTDPEHPGESSGNEDGAESTGMGRRVQEGVADDAARPSRSLQTRFRLGATATARRLRLWRRFSSSSASSARGTHRTRSFLGFRALRVQTPPRAEEAAALLRPTPTSRPALLPLAASNDAEAHVLTDTRGRTEESSRPGSLFHSRTASHSDMSIHHTLEDQHAEDTGEDAEENRPLSICTSNCRYDVVRRVAKRFGMKDVSEDEPWNLYWTDLSISLERCKDMKRFQKINHFPGMAEICRKDLLARNLNRMLRLFPKDYNFFPKTWCLPADLGDLCTYARTRRNRTYILKPDTGCQGKGIYLTRSVRDLKPHTRMICQVYIARPFLVDGFKFDMRVYTLVTSCDPLRVFVYNDGLVRFATSPYHEPNSHNTANVFMHLTNYAVNKHSRTFVVDEEAGSKRKISTLNKWLESKNYDVLDIWSRIDELIVKTLIAALPVIRHNYHACFPAHDFTYACFELLGFDILLDHKLKPYILEVNHSPSFHTDAQIDREVKENLLMDTFGILNLTQYDKRKVLEEDRRRVRDRLLQSISHKDGSNLGSDVGLSDGNPWKAQFEWEDNNMGNFRRVYPCSPNQPDKYEAFFHQNQSSLFQETAASRAREEASRQQRDQHEVLESSLYQQVAVQLAREEARRLRRQMLQVKQREEGARRSLSLARRKEYERLRPESPAGPVSWQARRLGPGGRLKRNKAQPTGSSKKPPAKYVLNSFQPEAICESEESIRAAALQERSHLVHSKGIVQMIYQMLKENKSLCAEDLRKYAALNADLDQPSKRDRDEDNRKLPSLLTLIQKTTGNGHVDLQKSRGALEPYEALVASVTVGGGGPPVLAQAPAPIPASQAAAAGEPAKATASNGPPLITGLGVMCAEAPFWVRPGLRHDFWTSHGVQHTAQNIQPSCKIPRITRSTLGRLVSTSLKLHNIEKRHIKPQAQPLFNGGVGEKVLPGH